MNGNGYHGEYAAEPTSGLWSARLGWAGIALTLAALLRASILDQWDGWCTTLLAFGIPACALWVAAHRTGLGSRARTRGARFGAQTLVSAALLLSVLVLVNFIAARHDASVDLTEAGLFTLAPQTKQVLHALPRDVTVYAFYPAGRRAQALDMLRRYSEESHRFHYELVDPDADPDRAQKYGVTQYGTLVVVSEGATSKAPPVKVEPDPNGQGGLTISEEKLTNALLKVARTSARDVYFLEGHGEGDINSTELNGYSRVATALTDQAFVVKPMFLARDPNVPADCAALIIAGPATTPLPGEMKAIEAYLDRGGRVLALVDPAPGAGMESFLDDWGISVGHDLVVDTSGAGQAYGAGPAMPLVKDYNAGHPITRDFRLLTFFPLARSVTPKATPGDADVMPIAQTSPESFAEPYSGGERHARFQAGHDRRGPIVLACAVARQTTSGKEARLVAIGSSNFVSNAFFDKAGNGDLFLNCVNWLASEDQLIAIRPRPRQDHRVELTDAAMRGIFWLVVVAMPAAALAAGCVVAWRRR